VRQTVVRLRASTTEDRYGNQVEDWDDPDELPVWNVSVAPRLQAEDNAQLRQGVPIGLTLYMPPHTDIKATDRVRVAGRVHRVDGNPAVWGASGIVVHLEDAEG
jgi:head-tail adaptor